MTSVTCPKCKTHISEIDLICLNCGYTITPEIREELVKEREKQIAEIIEKRREARKFKSKLHHGHPILKHLNNFSFKLFKTGWAELIVPIIILFLISIVIILMVA